MAISLPRAVRLTHRYIGVFIAPALLFFAFTGALQTFSLHETTRGSSYKPPTWIVVLSQIHKKQTPIIGKKKSQPAEKSVPGKIAPALAPPPPARRHNPLPLKLFFLLVAIGLFASTALGIYMAYKHSRNRIFLTALLASGVIVPIAMLAI